MVYFAVTDYLMSWLMDKKTALRVVQERVQARVEWMRWRRDDLGPSDSRWVVDLSYDVSHLQLHLPSFAVAVPWSLSRFRFADEKRIRDAFARVRSTHMRWQAGLAQLICWSLM
jgi:hypothetical protein